MAKHCSFFWLFIRQIVNIPMRVYPSTHIPHIHTHVHLSYCPCEELPLASLLMQLINSTPKSNPNLNLVNQKGPFGIFLFFKKIIKTVRYSYPFGEIWSPQRYKNMTPPPPFPPKHTHTHARTSVHCFGRWVRRRFSRCTSSCSCEIISSILPENA